jgi:endonuclease/exonuclease/phosphatase family metal-dependent hydrolase
LYKLCECLLYSGASRIFVAYMKQYLMKGLQNVLWFCYKWFAFYSLIVFAFTYWTPFPGWLAGFIMLSFPVTVIVNFICLVFWVVVKPSRAILPIVISLIALIFLPRTYAFNDSVTVQGPTKNTFKVMSYNVSSFSNPSDKKLDKMRATEAMKEWIADENVDILCFPEYANNDLSTRFNITHFFKNRGFAFKRLFVTKRFREEDYYGMALLSRYPIIDSRDTMFEARNGLIQADIKINQDTVRVIAVHLHSMSLKLYTLVGQKEVDGIKREGRNTLLLMKKGFKNRSREMEAIHSWVQSSPYPVIVCGDFNETPYSYVYGRTRLLLANSFEEKGRGFGFSYNRLPYFIRIDHQFYDRNKLELDGFTTRRDIAFSDHYPLIGTYSFR